MARIGFLGTGTIAAPMVRGLAGKGHEIRVSRRSEAVSSALARGLPEVEAMENGDVVAGSDVVVLCLLAGAAREVLPGLPWRAGQVVISAMADLRLADLRELCAPAGEVCRTIPLATIETGGCPLPVHPDCRALHRLYGAANPVTAVPDERALEAHFGATALSSALLDQMQEGADWLARQTGDRAAAEAYVAQLFAGWMDRIAGRGAGAIGAALDSLATEGGLNAALRAHMERAGARAALREGLDALGPRLGLDR